MALRNSSFPRALRRFLIFDPKSTEGWVGNSSRNRTYAEVDCAREPRSERYAVRSEVRSKAKPVTFRKPKEKTETSLSPEATVPRLT
jgi:hypothetical protein